MNCALRSTLVPLPLPLRRASGWLPVSRPKLMRVSPDALAAFRVAASSPQRGDQVADGEGRVTGEIIQVDNQDAGSRFHQYAAFMGLVRYLALIL